MSTDSTYNPAMTSPGELDRSLPDPGRRRFLTTASTVVGVAGVVAAAIPFIESLEPSARAKAGGAPVEVDISKLEPGQMLTVLWRKKPLWVVRRTKDELAELPKLNDQLKEIGRASCRERVSSPV